MQDARNMIKTSSRFSLGYTFQDRIFLKELLLCFSVCLITSSHTHAQCMGEICEHFKFIINEDVTVNHALQGHAFMTATARSAVKCHVLCRDDCRCISMNYFTNEKENNCQMNDANKYQKPGSLKPRQGSHYYDLVRHYTTRGGRKYLPVADKSKGECCLSNLCLNGGTCKEMCDPEGSRFKCVCPPGTSGRYCETKPKGCKDVWEAGNKVRGEFVIYDVNNISIPVFCDMDSEPGFIWTLILSYSFANRELFNDNGIHKNYPLNEDSFNWEKYRLSLPNMKYIAESLTNFRATCNFQADGVVYTDYARAELDGLDIFQTWNAKCRRYEFLNIRNVSCVKCTAGTRQNDDEMFHINSYKSIDWGCNFDGRVVAVEFEKNLGKYLVGKTNPVHRCTSADNSTTQFWFGKKTPGG